MRAKIENERWKIRRYLEMTEDRTDPLKRLGVPNLCDTVPPPPLKAIQRL
jgi:hypothetical protein